MAQLKRSAANVALDTSKLSHQIVITQADGGFELPAHAADGQQVELHAEKLHR